MGFGANSYSSGARTGGRPSGSGGFGSKPGGYGGYNGGRQGGSRPAQPATKTPASLPKDYLKNGYKAAGSDEHDVVYITDMAESIGKQLADVNSTGNTSTSKVRAYFDIVESIHHQLTTKGITDNNAIVSLATLKARVNNSWSKGNASKLFKDFIDKNVDQVIKSPISDLKFNLTGFKLHFEAVVCYMH